MIRINLGKGVTSYGVGLGGALAMILSYSINKPILWAALHGLCSWIYVVYFALEK